MTLFEDPSQSRSGAKPSTYHSLPTRLEIVEGVLPDLVDGDIDVAEAISRIAALAGRSKRTAERMLEDALRVQLGELSLPEDPLPEAFLVEVAKASGNIRAAYASSCAWPDGKPPLGTVYSWFKQSDPGLRLALKEGAQAFDAYAEVGVYTPSHRNVLWQMDEMHVPIRYRDERGREHEDLHMTSVFETFARAAVNVHVTVGHADAEVTAAILAGAVAGGSWDEVRFGGVPETLIVDNAWVFKSDAFKAAAKAMGIRVKFADPYTPQQKGMIERWHRTIQQMWLSQWPGYLDGPRRPIWKEIPDPDRPGKTKRVRSEQSNNIPDDPKDLLTLKEVAAGIQAVVRAYNETHVHSVTGMTPAARYASDPRPSRAPAIGVLWPFALRVKRGLHTAERRGLWVAGVYRRRAGILPGRLYEVRVLPGGDPRYLAGDTNGRFITEVRKHESEIEADARRERTRAKKRRVRRVLDTARGDVAARINGDATPAYESAKTTKRKAKASRPKLGSQAAANAVPPPSSEAA